MSSDIAQALLDEAGRNLLASMKDPPTPIDQHNTEEDKKPAAIPDKTKEKPSVECDPRSNQLPDLSYDTRTVNRPVPTAENQIEVPLGLSEDGTTAEAIALIIAPRIPGGPDQDMLDAMAQAARVCANHATCRPSLSNSSDSNVSI